ncbi:ribonuclease H protein [Pyrus ussuriensis x Pyrus communis]|uniref:Ribonuclease H protein n=1 Tax=Pyrus ussuriensis x Pyrus communis TaxID=2448454 RepID=A0A5N5FJE8_9ROSA|nr:ribonuclease H protein [Pyrus ussuriensis x Pyrus communis]
MEKVVHYDHYLGLPIFVGRSKKETFAYIKDHLWKKLNGWLGFLLSSVGKEILIKTVAQAIPLYTMQMFLFPKSFCEEFNQMVAQFWLGKEVAHHYPKIDFLQALASYNSSYCWKSVAASRIIIQGVAQWRVGDGLCIQTWGDSCPRRTGVHPSLIVHSVMVDNDEMRWNTSSILNWFIEKEARLSLSIPLSLFNPLDSMTWTKEPKAVFMTKSACFVAQTCHGLAGDELVGSTLNEETKFLWKALWCTKSQRKLNTFCYSAHDQLQCGLVLLLMLVWSFWMVCNEFIWKGVDASPLDVQLKAQKDENGSYGGIRIVIQNSTEGFMAVMVVQETGVSSAMHAEATAAWATTMFAWHWHEEQVQLEGDALIVVATIQNAGTTLHGHFDYLFADSQHILQGFKQWRISFGLR